MNAFIAGVSPMYLQIYNKPRQSTTPIFLPRLTSLAILSIIPLLVEIGNLNLEFIKWCFGYYIEYNLFQTI